MTCVVLFIWRRKLVYNIYTSEKLELPVQRIIYLQNAGHLGIDVGVKRTCSNVLMIIITVSSLVIINSLF